MEPWTQSFERECRAQVDTLCAQGSDPLDRDRAWKALLVRASPHVEAWVRQSPLLRRSSLNTPDDARAVLIDVIGRLWQRDFENLRRFAAAQRTDLPDDAQELSLVERLVRLESEVPAAAAHGPDADGEAEGGRGAEADGESEAAQSDATQSTPLRGWMLGVTRFVIKDHVKRRLGFGAAAAREVDGRRARTRRDLDSGAERFDDLPERGERPPITDLLMLRHRLAALQEYADTFPPEMKQALALWMKDESFDQIARSVGVATPERARALVRAAQARLRERFRGVASSVDTGR